MNSKFVESPFFFQLVRKAFNREIPTSSKRVDLKRYTELMLLNIYSYLPVQIKIDLEVKEHWTKGAKRGKRESKDRKRHLEKRICA